MIGRTQAWLAEHDDGWTEPVAVKVEVKVEGTETAPLSGAVKQEPGESGGSGGQRDRQSMAGLAAVKVELDVEGLPAPPLPGDALGRAGVAAEAVAAEVKSEQHQVDQVKVEIKTEVKSEIKASGQRLVKRTTVPPQGDAAVLASKRCRVGGSAPLGGAFCRRSRPRVPLPPVAQPPRQPIATAAAEAESVPEPHTSHAFDKLAPRRRHPWCRHPLCT